MELWQIIEIILTVYNSTDIKTSSACCNIATLDQSYFSINFILVGLWTVADGCVLNSVGNLFLSDKAGELAP